MAMRTRAIVTACWVTVLTGALFCALVTSVLWQAVKGHDVPWGLEFLLCGFMYACCLPGVLVPFATIAKHTPRETGRGVVSGIVLGIAYPLAVVLFAWLVWWTTGADMAPDRLVEYILGWMILAFITLVPGMLVSFLALYFERLVSRNRHVAEAP